MKVVWSHLILLSLQAQAPEHVCCRQYFIQFGKLYCSWNVCVMLLKICKPCTHPPFFNYLASSLSQKASGRGKNKIK
jgi:hypothetical protein